MEKLNKIIDHGVGNGITAADISDAKMIIRKEVFYGLTKDEQRVKTLFIESVLVV